MHWQSGSIWCDCKNWAVAIQGLSFLEQLGTVTQGLSWHIQVARLHSVLQPRRWNQLANTPQATFVVLAMQQYFTPSYPLDFWQELWVFKFYYTRCTVSQFYGLIPVFGRNRSVGPQSLRFCAQTLILKRWNLTALLVTFYCCANRC